MLSGCGGATAPIAIDGRKGRRTTSALCVMECTLRQKHSPGQVVRDKLTFDAHSRRRLELQPRLARRAALLLDSTRVARFRAALAITLPTARRAPTALISTRHTLE